MKNTQIQWENNHDIYKLSQINVDKCKDVVLEYNQKEVTKMKRVIKSISIIVLCLLTTVCSMYLYNKNKVDVEAVNASPTAVGNSTENELYVDSSMQGDINIEIGKEYIAFMCRDDLYNLENEFVIQGFQYGLRELQNQGVATVNAQSGNNLRVKNNVTGEWENVSDIVYLGQPQKTVSDAAFD